MRVDRAGPVEATSRQVGFKVIMVRDVLSPWIESCIEHRGPVGAPWERSSSSSRWMVVARLSDEVVTTSKDAASSVSRPRIGRPDQPIGRKVALSTFEPTVGFSVRVQLRQVNPRAKPREVGREAHRMHPGMGGELKLWIVVVWLDSMEQMHLLRYLPSQCL